MALHSLAGKPAPDSVLTNIPRLMSQYYTLQPDMGEATQRVSFGTSGHRGTSAASSFNEAHILAVSQAICEYRSGQGIDGPLFMGMDTHALSEAAHATALEVLCANGVDVVVQAGGGYTPTPVVSHSILNYNVDRKDGLADGIVITPSHNPPQDGGFKYNPPSGGPADTDITQWVADRANQLLESNNEGVKRMDLRKAEYREEDLVMPYVRELGEVLDMDAIRGSGLRIGADALGGAGLGFWEPIAEHYGLDLTLMHGHADATFRFMTVDHDGKIRMDCSSPYAMAGLIALKDQYDIAFGNDPDFDRHGIVTPGTGLMNPNHYLAVAIQYLYSNRPDWPGDLSIGKTLVSSSMIDRVAADLGRTLCEVPVGFKYFVDGLSKGTLGFGGEESAGASFLRKNGRAWSTDKDGIILSLLAAEITAVTGQNPAEHYAGLTERFGSPVYERMDAAANLEQKAVLKKLRPDLVKAETLAGDAIQAKLTEAPGNGESIGGLKVVTGKGWFAARPSGTEDIYKIYAESFEGADHLRKIQDEARTIVADAFKAAGV